MKLEQYFKPLADTAFGPWLTKYKNLFTEKDLNDDKLSVQENLDETDKDYKIVITSNDVCRVSQTEESLTPTLEEINPHVIGKVFTAITNIQLQQFSDFILHLPQDSCRYKKYFEQEQSKDSYSKIAAFTEVLNVDKLVGKFSKSSNTIHKDNYEPIKQGVQHLQAFISSSCHVEQLGEIMDISDCLE